jgi:dienelactone hydrolase
MKLGQYVGTVLAALLACVVIAFPASARFVEESIDLPVEISDSGGRSVRQSIRVVIYHDDERAKSPFLILNHGRSSDPAKRQGIRVTQYKSIARYLVDQGFAVFFVIRVGYGVTAGPDVENTGPCGAKLFATAHEAGAKQTVAVIDHAKSLPYVDPSRGVVMGQSFGGTIAIAIAAKNIPGVLATINFAGGGGGRPIAHPGEPCSPERMSSLFANYGGTARIPTLWLYSENDKYWGATLPRTWLKRFTDQGGRGEFVQLPPYKEDGHPIFTGNSDAWKPAVAKFLEACCDGAFARENPRRTER